MHFSYTLSKCESVLACMITKCPSSSSYAGSYLIHSYAINGKYEAKITILGVRKCVHTSYTRGMMSFIMHCFPQKVLLYMGVKWT